MNGSEVNRLSPVAAANWKQRYEILRQLAVEGSQILGVDPLGLVLLLRHGVAGWMRSWPGPTERLAEAPTVSQPPLVTVAPQWQQQLTQLLAQMSLAHLSTNAIL